MDIKQEHLVAELTAEQAFAYLSSNYNSLRDDGYEITHGRYISVKGEAVYILGRKTQAKKLEYLMKDLSWATVAKMRKVRSQRQHTIWPKSLLRDYYPDGTIVIYDINKKEWHNYGPRTFGVRKTFYAPEFEHKLMKFESKLKPALQELINGSISYETRATLADYIVLDICRKQFNTMDDANIMERGFADVVEGLRNEIDAEVIEEELNFFRENREEYMRVIRSNIIYDTRIYHWLMDRRFADMTWEIISRKSGHYFLLSDASFPMVLFDGSNEVTTDDLDVVDLADNFYITFPINSNYVLRIRYPQNRDLVYSEANSDAIRRFNIDIINRAHRYAIVNSKDKRIAKFIDRTRAGLNQF